MNAPDCTTVGCTGSCPDNAYLCLACTAELRVLLAGMPQLLAELETTITRQARVGSGDGGRKSAETQVPFHARAGQLGATLRNALVTWARHIAETRGVDVQPRRPIYGPYHVLCPHDSCATIQRLAEQPEGLASVWMLHHVDWLRHRREVTEAFAELVSLQRRVQHVIDRAPALWYCGPCDICAADLYARPGAAVVQCRAPRCSFHTDVTTRRDWLLRAAEDSLVNATDLARAVTALGQPVTPERVRKWAERGRLLSRGVEAWRVTATGVQTYRPTYRVGDVLDLLAAEAERRAAVA